MFGGIASAIASFFSFANNLFKHFTTKAANKKKTKQKAYKRGCKAVDKGNISGIVKAFRKLNKVVILVAMLSSISGCFMEQSIHVLENEDYARLRMGDQFTVPKDGYFFSDEFVKDVMEAKTE